MDIGDLLENFFVTLSEATYSSKKQWICLVRIYSQETNTLTN